MSISADFAFRSEAAPDGQAHAVSASRRIAKLPWTLISGKFSSEFGQKVKFLRFTNAGRFLLR